MGSLAGGFLYLLIGDFALALAGLRQDPDMGVWQLHVFSALRNSIVHNETFIFLSWSGLYFGFQYWRDARRERERTLVSNRLAEEAKLQMMRYQLDPRFLFNSLSSLHMLIRKSPNGAERMIVELSDFLRHSLLHKKEVETPLAEEIRIAKSYLDIEKIRLGESLLVNIFVENSVRGFVIPSLLIHPLLENAMRFGMRTSDMPLCITIKAERIRQMVRIRVGNTGRSVPVSAAGIKRRGGDGLKNLTQRLELAFPGRNRFEIFERDGWVWAQIEIRDYELN